MKANPSIAIVGAGAVGGYYGARLVQHGADVHFLLRSDYAHVRARGWSIRSVDGSFALPAEGLHVYDDVATMPKTDLVIVTLKSTENANLQRLVTPLLHDQTAILTLQNGLGNEDALARLFGAERVMGGIAFVCLNRVAPGVIEHQESGFIRIGEFSTPGRSERVRRVVERFNTSGIRTFALDDLTAGRWDKLVWNIPFNGLGALLDLTTEQVLANARGTEQVRAIMREVIAAARGNGVMLGEEIIEQKIAATRTMGAYRTSTQVDRQQGRPMEFEALFARPAEAARRAGVAVPLLDLLHLALSG